MHRVIGNRRARQFAVASAGAMDRIRLMCWCRSCVSGLHLPAFAAADGGLFAEQELEVEFVECVPAAGRSLGGYAITLEALARGDADFALSSVGYLLAGHTTGGSMGCRFAAVFHQRNPIAGLVREDSELERAEDLAGARAAGREGSWLDDEFAGALAYRGLSPPALVEASVDHRAALALGEVDVIPAWVDMLPGYRRRLPVRPIAVDIPVYATGLVAADRLALELVERTRAALRAGYELQRAHPALGIAALRRRHPKISEEHLRLGWSVLEPYAFDGPAPCAMDAERWRTTIGHTAAAHGLAASRPERVYRPELLEPVAQLSHA